MAQEARRVSIYNRMDKDPEVVETVEDKNISEKLHKEREQKRILYEFELIISSYKTSR